MCVSVCVCVCVCVIVDLCKLDEIDNDMGPSFPIQIIVSVGFIFSDGTQIDSKSKIATILKKVYSLVYSIMNPSSFLNNVSRRV